MKKYKVLMEVRYEFDIEDYFELTQEDVESYKKMFDDSYDDGFYEIENIKNMIVSELEKALFSNLPQGTPHLAKDKFKVKTDMEMEDIEVRELEKDEEW